MASINLTDDVIAKLISLPKAVENPGAKARTVGKHVQYDYRVLSIDGNHEFALFVRQSTVMHESFSAGLRWLSKTGESVTLIRMNGSSHPHTNKIEAERFDPTCHIHMATERYIAAGKKDEGYAEPTSEYKTSKGALHNLVKICNITGLKTTPDERDLFEY
jgi:hypothetical protein